MRRLPNSRLMCDSNGFFPSERINVAGSYASGGLFLSPSGSGKEDKMGFDAVEFGNRIVEARLKRGITQEQLAEMTDMSRVNMCRIERGVRTCSFEYLIRLATALDVSTDFLLMGRETDADRLRSNLQSVIAQMSTIVGNL